MIKMRYAKHGQAVSDFNARYVLERLISEAKKDFQRIMSYSTTNIFDLVMLSVAEGKIDHTHVEFWFKGKTITMDQFGRVVDDWPKGFLWNYGNIMEEILKAGFARQKEISDAIEPKSDE